MSMDSKREKYFLYNTLSILLKAVEKTRTTVDLRNEATIDGIIENADAYMNIVMKDCVFTDPRGDSFKYDMFFVQARNIRSVHVPMNIRIIPAIKQQLKQLNRSTWDVTDKKRTFKKKYAEQRQQEDLAAVENILEDKNTTKTKTTKNEDK
ncbi:PREDICTED: U7 snRNA-associated Sm-like protein LSm10 isoform X2 [Cyphomyrmex costatus]|uniref:U7 snRNA-associated Sm-like protein LSm10 isoform X2 n=1 Tax=Cyphomyrmex costatus TaxID=456900 RepID=UPI0008522449|nr:PREDICTED: U7 snRNA-associated Sm-like protein LSm10 isoform X2 [Cyphomyrmex costatus]